MKRILSTLSILSVLLFFNACSEPHGTYFDLGGQDFWAFHRATQNVDAREMNGKVNVHIYHLSDIATVSPIRVTATFGNAATEELFTVTGSSFSSVDEFNRATVVITYDLEELEFDTDYVITLTLSEQPDYPFIGTPVNPANPGLITTTNVVIRRAMPFTELGTGLFISDFFEEEWEQVVRLLDEEIAQAVVYRLPNLYENGRTIDVVYNGDGTVSIASQPAWWHSQGFQVEVRGTGVKKDGVITMQLEHWIPSLPHSWGPWEEILILP